MTDPSLIVELMHVLERASPDLAALARAWARTAPVVALVPAFGLRAAPAGVRATLGLSLAAAVAPRLSGTPGGAFDSPTVLLLEAARGLPVALVAASTLWIASMVGGVADELRGARGDSALPTSEQGATPTGALLALLAALAFLRSGGPARVAAALVTTEEAPLAAVPALLTGGVSVALAIAAPIVAASLVVEVGAALVARAAQPASVTSLLAPLRSLAVLGVLAVVLDRLVELLVVI